MQDVKLLIRAQDVDHDLYVVGSQESVNSIIKSMFSPSKEKFERLLLEELGPDFEKVSSNVLQAMHIIIIAKKRLIPIIKNVKSYYKATGIKNVLGNKGAVNVAFQVGDLRVNCISCHLASG